MTAINHPLKILGVKSLKYKTAYVAINPNQSMQRHKCTIICK